MTCGRTCPRSCSTCVCHMCRHMSALCALWLFALCMPCAAFCLELDRQKSENQIEMNTHANCPWAIFAQIVRRMASHNIHRASPTEQENLTATALACTTALLLTIVNIRMHNATTSPTTKLEIINSVTTTTSRTQPFYASKTSVYRFSDWRLHWERSLSQSRSLAWPSRRKASW